MPEEEKKEVAKKETTKENRFVATKAADYDNNKIVPVIFDNKEKKTYTQLEALTVLLEEVIELRKNIG